MCGEEGQAEWVAEGEGGVMLGCRCWGFGVGGQGGVAPAGITGCKMYLSCSIAKVALFEACRSLYLKRAEADIHWTAFLSECGDAELRLDRVSCFASAWP